MKPRKHLKVNGSEIVEFDVAVMPATSPYDGSPIEVVDLKVQVNEGCYRYSIQSDTRAPDRNELVKFIDTSLKKAMEDFLNVEISEYKERIYLFYKVQTFEQRQFTGKRIECG